MLLPIITVEKLWGCETLPAPFVAPAGARVGEIWFDPPADLPELLVKYIFTSEKLSVQVHPNDAQSQAAGIGNQGKEECWLVVGAQPGAVLGVGFDKEVDQQTMRAAALDGSIEDLLVWHRVEPGDFFYIPANTVHAIGPGVAIIEIQQNSDITYRLYDYGRPRELHLDQAIDVASGTPHDPAYRRHLPPVGHAHLVDGPNFTLDRVQGLADADQRARYAGKLLVMPMQGTAIVEGENVAPGQCALASSIANVEFAAEGQCLIAQPTA